MSNWKLEQAERRIAELETERDQLRSQIANHEAWATKVRTAVTGDDNTPDDDDWDNDDHWDDD